MQDLTQPDYINELSQAIYQQNKAVGWWDDPDRCILSAIQLINTEIAEATEGDRKNLMDDHLPHRKMAEVELADALIRALDLAGRFEWPMMKAAEPTAVLRLCKNTASRHLVLSMSVCEMGAAYISEASHMLRCYYSILVRDIVECARIEGYDLHGAMMEKLEYNRKRSDHKRENRAKQGGKKY